MLNWLKKIRWQVMELYYIGSQIMDIAQHNVN